ncbi:hypothetical protein ACET3X_004989 [Alternaria dauci]|uniref:Zn(2)-C6 fungal-type domain-containing protein n=1 Tax=Alternaria dauci TaxID=48095 RepID=A0ABR3UJC7_9PLEO
MAAAHAQPTRVRDANDQALWPQRPVQLARLVRGRQPKDALAKTVPYGPIRSLDQFETSLREYLRSPPEEPEHTEAQFAFDIDTTFVVPLQNKPNPLQQQQQPHQATQPPPPHQQQQQSHAIHQYNHAPPGYQPAHFAGPLQYQSLADANFALGHNFTESIEPNNGAPKSAEQKTALSTREALQPTADPKDKMRKQRAVAKCCVDTIQKIDGYRYSFHNCWNSREDDSFRFSYYCNDSLLNKDRAANGKGAKLGKRATKPVYDCKGVLSIKFSATKQTLDVFYKHVPIHKTYEERAPPPRKDSKRRKYLEENDPEALVRLASRSRQLSSEDPDTPRTKKKRSDPLPEPPRPSNTIESDLRQQSLRMLLELIQVEPPTHSQHTLIEPPPPRRPPPQKPHPGPRPILHIETQSASAPQRKRPRNSCDLCKTKKTKCDEPASGEDQRPPTQAPQPADQPAGDSELAKIMKELEETKAKLKQYEAQERASTTPVQTPQMVPRPRLQQSQAQHKQPPPPPPPQPQQAHVHQQPQQVQVAQQPRQRPQASQPQTLPHVSQQQQQPQRKQSISNHRQQLQQLNQGLPHGVRSPQQQLAYKMGSQSPQQCLQNPPQQLPQQQQQQQQIGSSQQSMTPQQQLQAAAAQQMQTTQLQTHQNYFTANHSNHSPYGTLNRPMPQNTLPVNPMASQPIVTQNGMSAQANAHLPQTQPQQPSGPTIDVNNSYGRPGEFTWAPTGYYGYQSAAQQQQQQQQQQQPQQQPSQHQDQWATARGSGVFR